MLFIGECDKLSPKRGIKENQKVFSEWGCLKLDFKMRNKS